MKINLKKITGIVLVGTALISSVAFAESQDRRNGVSLDKIGNSEVVLKDENSLQKFNLPVYDSGTLIPESRVN